MPRRNLETYPLNERAIEMGFSETPTAKIQNWIRSVLASREDLTPSRWARIAGLRESTLTRFLNYPPGKKKLRYKTILSLAEAAGVTLSGSISQIYTNQEPPTVNYLEFKVKDNALDLSGYLIGDRIFVDPNELFDEGAVIAFSDCRDGISIREWQGRHALLVSHSTTPEAFPPLMAQKDICRLIGVVVKMERLRKG